eukprot:5854534-Pleurochrysis_carterae.AAC.1
MAKKWNKSESVRDQGPYQASSWGIVHGLLGKNERAKSMIQGEDERPCSELEAYGRVDEKMIPGTGTRDGQRARDEAGD